MSKAPCKDVGLLPECLTSTPWYEGFFVENDFAKVATESGNIENDDNGIYLAALSIANDFTNNNKYNLKNDPNGWF